MPRKWKVRLSEAAEQDFDNIFLWTVEHFSIRQAHTYRDVILDALQALEAGPDILDSRSHTELPKNIKTLHVAGFGKRGRHFIIFDASMAGRIRVIRILHDSMDIPRHISSGQNSPLPD